MTKPEGFQLDHIGLAVNDLSKGLAKVEELTGLKPVLHPPEPGAPYQSASLKIGQKSFLEILGPNTSHQGIHPLKSLLRTMPSDQLTLWFWYVATDHFENFESKVVAAGRCIENKVTQDDAGSGEHSTYVRAGVGPGFDPVFPNIIQWKTPPRTELLDIPVCPVKEFSVVAANKDAVATFYEKVGISTSQLRQSDDGKSYLILAIETPKGTVEFKSEAAQITAFSVLHRCLKDLFQNGCCG